MVKKDVNPQKTYQSTLYLILWSELRFRKFTESWSLTGGRACG